MKKIWITRYAATQGIVYLAKANRIHKTRRIAEVLCAYCGEKDCRRLFKGADYRLSKKSALERATVLLERRIKKLKQQLRKAQSMEIEVRKADRLDLCFCKD